MDRAREGLGAVCTDERPCLGTICLLGFPEVFGLGLSYVSISRGHCVTRGAVGDGDGDCIECRESCHKARSRPEYCSESTMNGVKRVSGCTELPAKIERAHWVVERDECNAKAVGSGVLSGSGNEAGRLCLGRGLHKPSWTSRRRSRHWALSSTYSWRRRVRPVRRAFHGSPQGT